MRLDVRGTYGKSGSNLFMVLTTNRPAPGERHDVCLVGAGPVGIALALELGSRGVRTILLESGSHAPNSAAQSLSDAIIVDASRHDPMGAAVARRLGGTSTLWGGRCLPYDPADFDPRPGEESSRWPISLGEIGRYVPRACAYAHCGEPVFDEPIPSLAPADNRFTLTSLERWSSQPRFQKAYRRRLQDSPNVRVHLDATVVDFHPGENGGIAALEVAAPDNTRSRVTADQYVVCAGGLETTRLLLWLQRRRPDALGGVGGPLGRTYMGHLTGEIADIELSSAALDQAMDFHVDAYGSYVRRRFVPSREVQRAHGLTNMAFWPVVPPIADPRHGSGPLSAVTLALTTPGIGRRLLPEAIRRRHIGPSVDRVAHGLNVGRDALGIASFLPRFLWQRYVARPRHPALYVRNANRRYGLSYHAEHLPHEASQVTLSHESDRLGLPRLTIDLRFTEADARPIAEGHHLLGQWLRDTGLGQLSLRCAPEAMTETIMAQATHGTHQIGLARMAASSATGVVDDNLRAFGIRNLSVASAAVLPTSGQANPTLTALALAMRLADRLVAETAPGQRNSSALAQSAERPIPTA